jgi:asparagine synthase (glutamine-hydrolysing)
LRLSLADDPGLLVEWARRWSTGEIGGLLSPSVGNAVLERRHEAVEQVRGIIGRGEGGGFAEQQIRFHLLVDLPCDCLFKVDRMAMAHGLEVRVPLLSNAMLEYAARLPLAMRRRNGKTKEPLRSVAGALCRTLAEPAPKRGFEFPLESWLRHHLAGAWSEWHVTASLGQLGFNHQAVDAMLHRYTASTSPYDRAWLSGRLFDLLLLAVWADDHRVALG